jgi:GNAT superfamily N-acetyltransferase
LVADTVDVPASGWRLRPLDQNDAEAVSRIVWVAFRTMEFSLEPPPMALSETLDSIAQKIMVGGGVGAQIRDDVVGCAFWSSSKEFSVIRLAVIPRWRRQGIGRSLLGAADTEARRRGYNRVYVETRPELSSNRRLFASCGFKELSVSENLEAGARSLVRLAKDLLVREPTLFAPL